MQRTPLEQSAVAIALRPITIWMAVAAVALWIIWTRLELSFDLGDFLPRPTDTTQEILVDWVGQGAGSRLIFIAANTGDVADAGDTSDRIKNALQRNSMYARVMNGRETFSIADIPAILWANRYLLTDVDLSVEGLRLALNARVADLSLASDDEVLALIAADPYLAVESISVALDSSDAATADAWFDTDAQRALLIAETRMPAFDIDAQRRAMAAISETVVQETGQPPLLHGAGVYGAELENTIAIEARSRSLLASIAVAAILWFVYRRWYLVLIGALPLALGALAGLAAVAAIFDKVHGITLAFGFTLFGVAVEYPVHIFSHARNRQPATALLRIWPTMQLGAATTVIAYLTIALSGSESLAQLGCFSAVGVVTALVASRTLLPSLMTSTATIYPCTEPSAFTPLNRAIDHRPWIIALVISVAFLWSARDRIWNNDLSALTPMDASRLARDNELRAVLGAPEIRYLLAIRAPAQAEVLEKTEELARVMEIAASEHAVGRVQLVTSILPSPATQRRRMASIAAVQAPAQLLDQAVAGTPFKAAAFRPFISYLERLRSAPAMLTADSFRGSELEDFVTGNLYFDGREWISLGAIFELRDPPRIVELLATEIPSASLVDLKSTSEAMVSGYRHRVLWALSFALVSIAAVMAWWVGINARFVFVIGTLLASMSLTVTVSATVLTTLSLVNLVAVVLVAGLACDYALFLSRGSSSAPELSDSAHAVTVGAVTTIATFSILAASSIPVLHSIGLTVATGVAIDYVLALLGSRTTALTGR